MKRTVSLLFAMALFISACASPATSTSAPVEPVESTAISQPAEEVAPAENTATATFTPEPTLTPTPVPPSPRWYWAMDKAAKKVIGVNQFGERREIGTLDLVDDLFASVVSLDDERALLFLDSNDTLRLYLLTPAGMQKIKLPSEPFYFNTEFSQPGRAVVAVHGDFAVFTYVTRGAAQSEVVGAIDTGPVYLVDLKSLTAKLIDQEANRDPFDGNGNKWFHKSKDGRYLRYINGIADLDKMEIRELDLVTGEARTIYTTQAPPSRMYSSPEGDLWYLRRANIILDLNGNQTDFADLAQMASPLRDGKIIVYSWDCVDNCELKVITPFGNDAALTYNLPWTIESAASYGVVRQVLPDQSLLFAGMPYATLSNAPAIVETYPDLTEIDIPLFRLTPDGQARLVGLYVEGVFAVNVSADGRFILMQSTDKTSFFIYDTVEDRPLFDMPIDPELDYFVSARYLDNGILVNLDADVPGGMYEPRPFYHAYFYETSASVAWENVNYEIAECPDLLEDGTMICWFVRADDTSITDLIRYDPASGTKTVLLENAWSIEFIP